VDAINHRAIEREIQQGFQEHQIGSITQCVEPITYPFTLEWLKDRFNESAEIQGIPVERDGIVVGVIGRSALDRISENWRGQIREKELSLAIGEKPRYLHGDDSIDRVFDEIVQAGSAHIPEFFCVIDRNSFMGFVSFEQILRRVNELRNIDMDKAKEVQEYLLSRAIQTDATISLRAFNRMAGRVGGDFYQSSLYAEGRRRCVACFDVSGKGLSAALTTTIVGAFFTALGQLVSQVRDPAAITRMLDAFVRELSPEGTYVAAAIGYLDLEAKKVLIQNCGLCPVFILMPKEQGHAVKLLKPHLPPLGLGELTSLKQTFVEVDFAPGLRIVMFTDGLTDMRDGDGYPFGEERAQSLILDSRGQSAEEFVALLDKTTSEYQKEARQVDDITVLDLRFS